MKLYQTHLNLPGMNGRGVRFRLLPASAVREAEADAAKILGQGATVQQYRNACLEQCLFRMVAEVTDEGQIVRDPVTKLEKDPGTGEERVVVVQEGRNDLATCTWHKVTLQQLSAPTGPHSWDALFGAKETDQLELLYQHFHEISPVEKALISGKAVPVVT